MAEQTNINKVLIANRGEIAVRIIRTCRDLGIPTVAVWSDADRTALHVRFADEAVHVGEPAPASSYLRMDALIEAARRTGADAIHPGYGFLAENADFAQQVLDEGLVWIGPPPSAIATMGDKQAARSAVTRHGVPLIPGSEAGLRDEDLGAEADRIGYPLLVKAVAGGGGVGMRKVLRAEDFEDALATARREASSAFGNGDVYLERLLTGARHIEFQILADTHGNTIHLGERNARFNGATRNWSRKRPRSSWTQTCASAWAPWPSPPRVRSAMSTLARSSAWSIASGTFTFWK